MEVHRQRCQACGSRLTRNLLRREPGRPPTVYVRCAECHALVARYELETYYHHGKGFESWLTTYRGTIRESGRGIRDEFEQVQREALEGYEHTLEIMRAEGKDPDEG